MSGAPDLALVASLLADPSRARMLMALMAGQTLPAMALAAEAGVRPATASSHPSRLVDGGLVAVEPLGRYRYYRLASAEVAELIEALTAVAPRRPLGSTAALSGIHLVRSCYDHLAGAVGVALADALVRTRALRVTADRKYVVSAAGERLLSRLDLDCAVLRAERRQFARCCLDWTERRFHVAGALGAAILRALLERGWVERKRNTRALRLTPDGRRGLQRLFDIDVAAIYALAGAAPLQLRPPYAS